MTNLLTLLESARPSDASLSTHLSDDMHDRIRTRIQVEALNDVRSPNRRRGKVLAIAAAVAGLVAAPGLFGIGGSTAHAELTALAMAAVRADGPVIAQGTYLHVKTEAVQRNSSLFGDGKTLDTNREMWIRWDGQIWAVDTRPSTGWREYHLFTHNEPPSINNPTPEFASSLPQDTRGLGKYLHDNVQGSNSHEEAMFVAVTDLASSNLLPPKALSAALEVLAGVDGVDAKDVVVRDRPAVEISFSRWFGGLRGKQAYTLDRATARVIAVKNSDPGGTYESETTLVEVADRIPQDVLDKYTGHGNGERVYEDGHARTPGEG